MRTAFLCPGQGSQSPGLLKSLADESAVRDTLAEAQHVLEVDLAEIDSAKSLQSTIAVQLSTLIAGVAYARLLELEDARPDAVAGLSVGAFTAAVISGALSFDQALRLVKLRAESMDREFGQAGYGMAAILGLSEAAVRSLLDRVPAEATALYVASVNAAAEIVIAGTDAALSAATREAEQCGGRVRRLNVSVPSHGVLLERVSTRLREAMSGLKLNRARVPYVSNHRARSLEAGADIAEDLILNVSRTVRWHESVQLLYELGVRVYIEMPPSRALSSLVKADFSEARAVAAVDTDRQSIERLVRL